MFKTFFERTALIKELQDRIFFLEDQNKIITKECGSKDNRIVELYNELSTQEKKYKELKKELEQEKQKKEPVRFICELVIKE